LGRADEWLEAQRIYRSLILTRVPIHPATDAGSGNISLEELWVRGGGRWRRLWIPASGGCDKRRLIARERMGDKRAEEETGKVRETEDGHGGAATLPGAPTTNCNRDWVKEEKSATRGVCAGGRGSGSSCGREPTLAFSPASGPRKLSRTPGISSEHAPQPPRRMHWRALVSTGDALAMPGDALARAARARPQRRCCCLGGRRLRNPPRAIAAAKLLHDVSLNTAQLQGHCGSAVRP
jgi:hypothetical protein